jgi:hypothetical protein
MRSVNPVVRAMRSPALGGARMFLRRLQGSWRVLPGFLIIGAQKSGTSSLHSWLGQHPQVRESIRKEVHFFDGGVEEGARGGPRGGVDTYALGEAWYRAHFPLRLDMTPGQTAFESSPAYLFHPLAAERIAALMPEAKLVAILRNPTDRALSHYFHNMRPVKGGIETLPVGEAMDAEEARLAPVLARGDYRAEAFRAFSYKARGRYLEQLERYWARFPRENLLVLRSEDLFDDPAGLMARLFDFLELDRTRTAFAFKPLHVGSNREAVDPEVRAALDAHFAPLNRALYAAVGRDFGW